MRSLLIIAVITLNVAYSNSELLEETGKEIAECANKFSLKLYKVASGITHGNAVFATYSIFLGMSLITRAARGDTKRQMRQILELPAYKRHIDSGFTALNRRLKTIFNRTATDFNAALYHPNDAQLKNDFKNMAGNIYHVTLHPIANNPDKLLYWDSAEFFSCYSLMERNVQSLSFANHFGKVNIKSTMKIRGKFRHGELPEINAKFVEISCVDAYNNVRQQEVKLNVRSTSIFVILPNKPDGLEDLEKNIEKISIEKLLSSDVRDVSILLPTEFFHTNISVNSAIQKMGLTNMYNDPLSGIAESVKIHGIRNHAFLEFLKIKLLDKSAKIVHGDDKFIEYKADRPFINIVVATDDDPVILQIARYAGPQKRMIRRA